MDPVDLPPERGYDDYDDYDDEPIVLTDPSAPVPLGKQAPQGRRKRRPLAAPPPTQQLSLSEDSDTAS